MTVSKIGNYSNSENVKFLERQFAVCRVVLADGRGGTGFLIGKNLIMTNNHVIPNEATALKAKAIFFYTTGALGIEVNLDPNSFFCTSLTPDQLGFKPITAQNLDFTIVSIESHPKIAKITHLAFCIFDSPRPKKGGHANIIHHPLDPDGTCWQKISFRDNIIGEVGLHTLHYTTFTMPGSSGSPVMDDQGNLFALHRATCTEILGNLLKVLDALLGKLFPSAIFTLQKDSVCAIVDDAPLYIFSKGELKGRYYHEGKMSSPASLLMLLPKPAKEWALQFLKQQGSLIPDHHKECNTAVPIHAICTHLQKGGYLDFIKTQYAACQKNIVISLKEVYLRCFASMPLVLTNAAFPIESFFTQLSIVSHSSQEEKEKQVRNPHLVEKDSLREIHKRLCSAEKEIEIHNLFDDRDGKPIKRVLLLGRAGIGKSTLCQKIAYDWASDILFHDKFTSVYHMKLRELNAWAEKNPLPTIQDSDKWLSYTIAQYCYEGSHQEQIYREIQNHPDKVLLLFDGWDEASPELTKVIERCLRETKIKHCLLTSRPGVTSKIQGSFDLAVENMGFSHQHIETYAEKFFSHIKSEGAELFLQTLRSRTNLFAIAHIPIQLQILCALWQQGIQRFPQTLTSMFSKIVGHLFGWEQERGGFKNKNLLYQALGEIGLKGLETKQLIIPQNMVDGVLRKPCFRTINAKDLITTGLIKVCDSGELYFIHLTYQEYSIAQYISSLSEHEQCTFVQNYRYKPHFHLVIRMLAGSLWEESNGSIDQLEKFFTWLYTGHIDMVGAYQTELVLSCLDECRNEKLEELVWQKYKIADFVDEVLKHERRRDCLIQIMSVSGRAFAQVMKKAYGLGGKDSKIQAKWFFDHLGQCIRGEYLSDDFWAFFQRRFKYQYGMYANRRIRPNDEKIHHATVKALRTVAAHVSKESIPSILSLLQTALGDKDSDVRRDAAQALGVVAAHADKESIPSILSLLQTALGDNDLWVCLAAVEALGVVGAHADQESISSILSLLQIALGYEGLHVRNAAAEALRAIATHTGKKSISLILSSLKTALGDKDSDVRRDAVRAFGTVAPHADQESIYSILSSLKTALDDESLYVRGVATKALGIVAAHAGRESIPSILRSLQTALGDKESYVRLAAAEALGAVAAHTDKESILSILSSLQTALGDENSDVRLAAAKTFRAVAAHVGRESIHSILSSLQTAFGDKSLHVRKAAAETLGVVAAHAGKESIHSILSSLQTALGDENSDVRYAAAKTFRAVAAHAGRESIHLILSFLQTALGDADKWVRKAAAEALEAVAVHADKESIPSILSLLQTSLGNESSYMRDAAPSILSPLQIVIGLGNESSYVRDALAKVLGLVAAHAGGESIHSILSFLQAALGDEDPGVSSAAAEALGVVAAHAGKESISLILSSLKIALGDENSDVRYAAVKALKAVAAHAGRESILSILSSLQTALGDESLYVREAAAETLRAVEPRAGKESIPSILSSLQAALGDKNSDVCKAAAKVLNNLNTQLLLPIFISQSTAHSTFQPLIFEHFVSQTIPLYITETSAGCFIQTGDANLCPFDISQKTAIVRLCAELMYPSVQKPPEKPETCLLQ